MTAFRFHVFCVRCFHVHTLSVVVGIAQILCFPYVTVVTYTGQVKCYPCLFVYSALANVVVVHVHTLLLLLVVVQILYALSHRQWQGVHVH